jgi:2-polyprenyl-6-methoxyphenol hydroxylase-like FAD-dependent oxidoreductase
MANDYDAIVVGARCAGAPTAMLLARKGYRVLLLDRASFPSDTLSTHYIHQTGAARLKRWALLDAVAASNCPPIRRQILDIGPFALSGSPTPYDGVAESYAPRRTVLDKILVDAAVQAGAELREHFTVSGLTREGGRVTGVTGRARGGDEITESARIVIGADGMHSFVARDVDAPVYEETPPQTCVYYTYWSGAPMDAVELYPRPDRMIIAAPTNDGQTLTIIYWPRASFETVRADIEGNFLQALELAAPLAERLRTATRTEKFSGSADLPNFFRRPFGPGWALVGDAGYHKDPILAQGISDAFRDVELLTDAVDAGLAGRRPLEAALADYEQQRNAAAMPTFQMTLQFASLAPPPPESQQLMAALRGNQEQIDRFFGTFTGAYPVSDFFAPENIEHIFAAQPAMG